MQNLGFSEFSGGRYCCSNMNGRIEIYAANMLFMW